MGLGIAAVQSTLELWQQGLLNTANKVVEMGSQELHLKTDDFEDMVNMAGMNNYKKENFPTISYTNE